MRSVRGQGARAAGHRKLWLGFGDADYVELRGQPRAATAGKAAIAAPVYDPDSRRSLICAGPGALRFRRRRVCGTGANAL